MAIMEDHSSKEKEKAAQYWYNQGYRDTALQEKIAQTVEDGQLVSEDYITCAGGVCD
jgi:hypothetical protein